MMSLGNHGNHYFFEHFLFYFLCLCLLGWLLNLKSLTYMSIVSYGPRTKMMNDDGTDVNPPQLSPHVINF